MTTSTVTLTPGQSMTDRPGAGAIAETPPTFLSLFAGIGGFDLGFERAGLRCVGQVEKDPFCQRVLAKHWPEVPRHDDIHTTLDWWHTRPRPRVDVVAGGFPCQPTSNAGRKMAQADPRWLWPAMADIIDALRPTWVVGENVPGLRTRGLADVHRDLYRLGYRVRTGVVTACAMGAPHPRPRLLILAHTTGQGRCPWRPERPSPDPTSSQHPRRREPARGTWWTHEPRLDRVAYGIPAGMDRRRTLGNAVLPQIAEHIARLITTTAVTP